MPDHGPTPCTLPRRGLRRTGTIVACTVCHQFYTASWACAADSCVRTWDPIYPKPRTPRPTPQSPQPDARRSGGMIGKMLDPYRGVRS